MPGRDGHSVASAPSASSSNSFHLPQGPGGTVWAPTCRTPRRKGRGPTLEHRAMVGRQDCNPNRTLGFRLLCGPPSDLYTPNHWSMGGQLLF